MYVGSLILAARSRCGFWPTKVIGVAGYKSPIAFEDYLEQVPILDALATDPNDMRAFAMAALARDVHQLRTQTFINEKLHAAVAEGPFATATLP